MLPGPSIMILNLVVSALPICLPPPGLDFRGKETVAMGWGQYENWAVKKKRRKGSKASNILKYVRLKVSNRKFNTKNFFGTEVNNTKFEPILEQCNKKNIKELKNDTHINKQKTLRDTLGAIQN